MSLRVVGPQPPSIADQRLRDRPLNHQWPQLFDYRNPGASHDQIIHRYDDLNPGGAITDNDAVIFAGKPRLYGCYSEVERPAGLVSKCLILSLLALARSPTRVAVTAAGAAGETIKAVFLGRPPLCSLAHPAAASGRASTPVRRLR